MGHRCATDWQDLQNYDTIRPIKHFMEHVDFIINFILEIHWTINAVDEFLSNITTTVTYYKILIFSDNIFFIDSDCVT